MGENGTKAVLNSGGLTDFAAAYPPKDLEMDQLKMPTKTLFLMMIHTSSNTTRTVRSAACCWTAGK